MRIGFWLGLLWMALGVLPCTVWAGGTGLNVAVVVNASSPDSMELGNYYCQKRQIPPQNLIRIYWTGGKSDWSLADFQTVLLNPFRAALADRQLTNQIDFVVLSMDIPYRVISPSSLSVNSTTSCLFYGFKSDPEPQCSIAPGSTNWYAGTEGIFRSTPPVNSNTPSYLVTMITASNLPLAKLVVDQGVASDGAFPTQTTFLTKGADPARNVRYVTFDNAIFNTRLRSNYAMVRIEADSISFLGPILGAQTGSYSFPLVDVSFVPGALADNLTSYGGQIFFETGGHLNILALLAAGASGTYGTVDEPCNYLEKFPSPQNYFYQARGFSVAECYYLSVTNPYQGLVMGEPLAAPFARRATGSWANASEDAPLRGLTNLSFSFSANDATHPLQQVDLFVDGNFNQTLTNIAPGAGNLIYINVKGMPLGYTVPPAATVKSMVDDLTGVFNNSSNTTLVAAFAHGDRIELHSLDVSTLGAEIPISVSNSSGFASTLTVTLSAGRSDFLDTIAFGTRTFQLKGTPAAGDSLRLTIVKTNGTQLVFTAAAGASGSTLSNLVQQLIFQVNADDGLSDADGCVAQDFLTDDSTGQQIAVFSLVARSPGWAAARIQTSMTNSADLIVAPTDIVFLDENLEDLQPRNHLYVTAGVTNLPVTFPFDTTLQADGYHELTAVCYEGGHVRTARRISRRVQIQNGTLSATLTTSPAGTNFAVETTLKVIVAANRNVAHIQLLSTGGLIGTVGNQSNAVFNVAGTDLGPGLHPFVAVLTEPDGNSYRTETQWITVVGQEPPFKLSAVGSPIILKWPATIGRTYRVESAPRLSAPFEVQASFVATNSTAIWSETNSINSQRYYRVRAVY